MQSWSVLIHLRLQMTVWTQSPIHFPCYAFKAGWYSKSINANTHLRLQLTVWRQSPIHFPYYAYKAGWYASSVNAIILNSDSSSQCEHSPQSIFHAMHSKLADMHRQSMLILNSDSSSQCEHSPQSIFHAMHSKLADMHRQSMLLYSTQTPAHSVNTVPNPFSMLCIQSWLICIVNQCYYTQLRLQLTVWTQSPIHFPYYAYIRLNMAGWYKQLNSINANWGTAKAMIAPLSVSLYNLLRLGLHLFLGKRMS